MENAVKNVAVLIPAYQPDELLVRTVSGLLENGAGRVVVVDDGSDSACRKVFDSVEAMGVHVCRHPRNRGKGAALKTGIAWIRENVPDCLGVVTADADGQHAPADVLRVAELTYENPGSLILGVRDFSGETVPWRSRAGNRITSLVFRWMTGIRCGDTQTGLRGIPAALFNMAEAGEGERYEYEINFLLDAAEAKVPFVMEPIQTIYLDDNRASHFRVVRDSYLVYRRPLTFALVAAASALADLGAFWLLSALFPEGRRWVFAATVAARLLSGALNFFLNKRVTFRSRGDTGGQSLRYLCLFLAVMLVSGGTVAALSRLPVPTVLIKVVVDGVLFVVNYIVERKWVFKKSAAR